MIKKLAQKTIYKKALNDLSRRDDMLSYDVIIFI